MVLVVQCGQTLNNTQFPECILFYINKYNLQLIFFSLSFPFPSCRYVAVYFSILYFRYRAGIVTKEMLSVPKIPFLIVGILESLALTSGMAAAGIFTLILPLTFHPLSRFLLYTSICSMKLHQNIIDACNTGKTNPVCLAYSPFC